MKPISSSLKDSLKTDVTLHALPRLTAEWNYNRYADVLSIRNSAQPEGTVERFADIFPIESIVEPRRPRQGIMTGSAVKWEYPPPSDYQGGYAEPSYADDPSPVRTYTVGPDAIYKYWQCPSPSNVVQSASGDYEFPADGQIAPQVIYREAVLVNKIVVGFESSWATPTRTAVQVTKDGTTWTTIATNPGIDSNGRITLYLNGAGAWGAAVNRSNSMSIFGMRVIVTAIDKPDSFFGFIEISPRLENDLTSSLISYTTNFSMDEPNMISPLGVCSSNTADVVLSNIDNLFNNENPDSPYFGIIDSNVLFTLDLVYEDLGSGIKETVREFTMFTDVWGGQQEHEVEISLKDSSKFMQEQQAPKRLFEEVTVGEAVWRLCDAMGFVDYEYIRSADAPSTQIPYFWTDGEKNVWAVFQELAEATQTAIYFDEYNILKIVTRDAAFDKDKPVVWNFSATNEYGLADVEEVDITNQFEANNVDIVYKETKLSDWNRGFPVMEKVWEPEGTLTLRASPLALEDLTLTSTQFRIRPEDAKSWPFEGLVEIQGELIRYKGKRYRYYVKNPVGTKYTEEVVLFSQEEQVRIDRDLSDEHHAYKNDYTGHFTITERGVNQSNPATYTPNGRNLTVTSTPISKTTTIQRGQNAYIQKNLDRSSITFGPGPVDYSRPQDWHTAKVNVDAAEGKPANHFGTSIKITGESGLQQFGFFFHQGTADSGYYIQILSSKALENPVLLGRTREISLVQRRPDGSYAGIPTHYKDAEGVQHYDAKGVPHLIATDVWYDIDVHVTNEGGKAKIEVRIDGVPVAYYTINAPLAITNTFGVFIQNNAQIEVEYLYAFRGIDNDNPLDDQSMLDSIRGGYASQIWKNHQESSWVWRGGWSRDRYSREPKETYFFEEFGPIFHEYREFEVEFEKSPVVHSRLALTNESQVMFPEYSSDPFSARFVLANASRLGAIVSGEDTISFGKDSPVTQTVFIYGRVLFQEDGETVNVRDEAAIRARGRVDVNIESQWIQSKAEAQSIADWVVDNWSGGSDEVTLTSFGNPFVELTDIISLHFPEKGMYYNTHFYFVVGVQNSFDQGFTTELTLRRAKI